MNIVRATALTLSLLTTSAMVSAPQAAQAQVFLGISVRIAPPPLPVYEQPPLPGPDYIWTPGYWAWDDSYGDYYWVPGAWVQAPQPGYLWTPSYWGWENGLYVYHGGYWGPHIGFYGGVNYGFGYTGDGFEGGYWNGGHYFYNRSVNNFGNVHITNVYNKTVIVNQSNRVSYNGGPGGVAAQPTQQQLAVQHERHIQATPAQTRQVQAAHSDRSLFASANHGAPPVAATQHAGQLKGPGVVRANNAPTVTAVKLAPGEARAARAQGGAAGAHPEPVNAARPANEAGAHGPSALENKPGASRPMTSEARPSAEARPGAEARPMTEPHNAAEPATHPAPVHSPMTEERRAPAESPEHAAPRPYESRAETPRPPQEHMAAPRPAESRPMEARPMESRPMEARPAEARPAEPRPAAVHAAPPPHPPAPHPPAPHPKEEPREEHPHG